MLFSYCLWSHLFLHNLVGSCVIFDCALLAYTYEYVCNMTWGQACTSGSRNSMTLALQRARTQKG